MTDRVYPDKMVSPVTPLCYDGADYRAVRVDAQPDGDWSLRTSTPVDRASTLAATFYAGTALMGTVEAKWTYTVPAGKRAFFSSILAILAIPATAGNIYCYIIVNTYKIFQHIIVQGVVQPNHVLHYAPSLWLKAGDVVAGWVGNSTGADLAVTCNAFITEFDA